MNDLSMVSMEDIWEELKRRHDAVIMVTNKSYDDSREGAQISYKGGKFICVGLAQYAVRRIMDTAVSESGMEGEA